MPLKEAFSMIVSNGIFKQIAYVKKPCHVTNGAVYPPDLDWCNFIIGHVNAQSDELEPSGRKKIVHFYFVIAPKYFVLTVLCFLLLYVMITVSQ